MYQKIADIENNDEILDLIDELLDRYGDIPKETDNLLKIVEIRNMCRKLGINRCYQNGNKRNTYWYFYCRFYCYMM